MYKSTTSYIMPTEKLMSTALSLTTYLVEAMQGWDATVLALQPTNRML